jgi:hypothetical protein
MKLVFTKLRETLCSKSGIRDAALVSGLLLLFAGLWIERPSAACIVVGALLFVSAAWSASR